MTDAERQQAEIFPQALAELRRGHPRLFIEKFLWIMDGDRQVYVPFKYVETQVIADQEIFQPMTSITDPTWYNILKARQVKMSSFFFALEFASAVNWRGTEAIYVFQDEKTGKTQEERLQIFEDRMPKWFWEHDGAKIVIEEKSTTFRRYGFYLQNQSGGWDRRGSSSINIVSAGSATFGAGPKYNFAVFDEYDEYSSLRLYHEVTTPMSKDASWVFKVTNPRGMKQMWTDYKAAKEGKGGKNLVFYCFMNNSNHVKAGSIVAPEKFRYDFELTAEHRQLMGTPQWRENSIFKGDDVYLFFRWFETEMQRIRQMLETEGIYSEKRVRGEFFAQHLTDDIRCWRQYGKSPFDEERLADDIEIARETRPKSVEKIGEKAELRFWKSRRPERTYAFSLDPSLALPTSDTMAGGMWDDEGSLCVSLYCDSGDLGVICRRIASLLLEYNSALLAPEVDGKLGLFVIEEVRREWQTLGAEVPLRIWRVPKKDTETEEHYARDIRSKLGWHTQYNKEAMIQNGIARYNNGDFVIPEIDLLAAMQNYDIASKRHTDDWLMMFFTGAYVTHPNHRYGRQFQTMAAERGLGSVSVSGLLTDVAPKMFIIPTSGGFLPRGVS